MGAIARAGVGLPLALGLSILLVGASPAAGGVERVMIDPEVSGVVHDGGARVLVELRLPDGMRPEGELAPEAARAQRQAIAAAERVVLSRLSGSRFSLLRQYETVPLLLLEVHDDALTALERMGDVVARVRLDKPTPLAAPGAER